jgi:hypothetical protein
MNQLTKHTPGNHPLIQAGWIFSPTIKLWRGVRYCLLLAGLILAGCAGESESPRLVASYPTENEIAIYPFLPPGGSVVYDAEITLEVANFRESLRRTENLVYAYGGYLSSSQSWYQDDRPFGIVVLAVPSVYFDQVHQELLTMGNLVAERVSGEVIQPHSGSEGWRLYSQVVVHLQQRDSAVFAASLPDWRPLRTLRSAWGILISILGFLTDILIWIGVVAGPFLFLGWIVNRLLKRGKKTLAP